VIYVDHARCVGCGTCVKACQEGAIRLENEVAMIEQSLCSECGVCLGVCPNQAIFSVSEPIVERLPETVPVGSSKVIRIEPPPAPQTRPAAQPVLASALAYLGREIVPRALDWLLNRWDQRGVDRVEGTGSGQNAAVARSGQDALSARGSQNAPGGGRQRRRRRRGGR
jgi:NAD-dependent dihydropyrimidine dehydrogenase PreA subunit